ncbi:MAG TPA: T9SS type A sorting domain-containing protein, partial [Bacteroidia bacterium]
DCSGSIYNLSSSVGCGYVAAYSNLGDLQFVESYSDNRSVVSNINSINDTIYLSGYYEATCDFDFSVVAQNSTSNGGRDVFFGRYFLNTLGIQDVSGSTDLIGIPNPFLDHIQFKNSINKAVVTIYDEIGKQVLKEELGTSKKLNTSQLEKGMYVVELFEGNNISREKMIKQ